MKLTFFLTAGRNDYLDIYDREEIKKRRIKRILEMQSSFPKNLRFTLILKPKTTHIAKTQGKTEAFLPCVTPCSNKTHLAFHSIGLHHELRCHQFLFCCHAGSFRHFISPKKSGMFRGGYWNEGKCPKVNVLANRRKGRFTKKKTSRTNQNSLRFAIRAKPHRPDLPFVLWHNSIQHPIAFPSNSPPLVHHKPLDLQWP